MKQDYIKEYSEKLSKEIELNVYGSGGYPVLMVPAKNGRFFQYGDMGVIDSVKELVDNKQIQIFTVDGCDSETINCLDISPQERIEKYENYISYITDDVTEKIKKINNTENKPIVVGCSDIGGFHASNLFFRFPELFVGLISLSGVFSIRDLFLSYGNNLLDKNSPLENLKKLKQSDAKYMQYLRSRIILCCGQGNGEEKAIESITQIKTILEDKKIPAFVDLWGHDVSADWFWWQKQLPYGLKKILDSL